MRGYQWEFAGGLQHELLPRVSVSVELLPPLYRRQHDRHRQPQHRARDYVGPFCIPMPSDPRLPNGGGFQVCDIYELTQAAFDRPADNVQTFL